MEQINVNLVPGKVKPVCHASQYDIGRTIRLNLYSGDAPYTLSGTESISWKLRRPDFAEITVEVTNTSSSYVEIVTTEESCAVSGDCECELRIDNGTSDVGSANFKMAIEPDAFDGELTTGEVSGQVATFHTSLEEDLIEHKFEIVAVESGSGTKSPTNPYIVNGFSKAILSKTGKNLFNKATITENSYFDGNGNIQTTTSSVISDYINVKPSTAYYFGQWAPSTVARYVVWFDKDKNIISTTRPDYDGGTKTSPDNAAYVRVSIGNDYVDSYQLELGTSGTSYESYVGKIYKLFFGRTVFRGEVDVKRNKIKVTHVGFTVNGSSSENWTVSRSGTANFYYSYNLPTGSSSAVAGSNVANIFETVNIANNNTAQGCYVTASALRVRWGTELSVTNWKTWLSTNNLTVYYELSTYLEYDLVYGEEFDPSPLVQFISSIARPIPSVKLQIVATESGSGTKSPSNPYTLGGFSNAVITKAGKNLLSEVERDDTRTNNIYFWNTSGYVLPAGTYTFSLSEQVSGLYILDFDTNTNLFVKYNSDFITFTLAETKKVYFGVYKIGIDHNDKFQLELGSIATAYEPCTATQTTLILGQTVYGGEIDVTNGKLKITHKIYTLGTKTAYNTSATGHNYTINNISDMFNSATRTDDIILEALPSSVAGLGDYFTAYHQGTNCVVGVPDDYSLTDYNSEIAGTKIVYPLATPIEVDITPQEITALMGINNLWSDTGDVSGAYQISVPEDAALAGNNVIFSNTNGNTTVKYYKTIND